VSAHTLQLEGSVRSRLDGVVSRAVVRNVEERFAQDVTAPRPAPCWKRYM
jgi:hypothetical protein